MPPFITQLLQALNDSRRALLALVGIGAFLAIWGFARWGVAPEWVPVVSGLPLERMGAATQRLEEQGIEYRLDRGGAVVSVPGPDVARARILLASEGLTGDGGRPGFELFDQPSWGMTDFTQRVNYRRALEGELERTISGMRGVESAQVHLALREASFLARGEDAGEASVVLRLASSFTAGEAMVQGIQTLVASSVEGMEPRAVTVLDDRGRLLSVPDDDSGIGLTTGQLRVRRRIEEYLERKAEAVVSQIVGPGNATVRVAADLNFDRVDRTVQAVDPDQQLLVSEDRAEITPGDASQGAASVTVNTVFEATRSVETLSRGGARLERLTVAVVLADRRVEDAAGNVTWEPRPPAELQRVEGLVRNAVGISLQRGDEISVVSAPPEVRPDPIPTEEGLDFLALATVAVRPLLALMGLLTALFLALRLVGAIKETAPPVPARLQAAGSAAALPPAETAPAEVHTGPPPPAEIAPPPRPFEMTDPEMTARVLRSWMRET